MNTPLTLILLPGMDGTGLLFESFITALGKGTQVVVVSYPATQVMDYAALESVARDALPTEGDFVILGESFSGPIAISIAASHPDRLKGLILCCTFVSNPRPSLSIFKPFIPLLPVGSVPMPILEHFTLGQFSSGTLRTALARALSPVSQQVFHARLKAVVEVNVSSQLKSVAIPVLYLQAMHDQLVPDTASRNIAQLCPHTEIVPLDAPHLLLQARPEKAAVAVSDFLRTLRD